MTFLRSILLCVLLLWSGIAGAECTKVPTAFKLGPVAVLAGGTGYTERVQLNEVCGYFTVSVKVTGTGTAEISYQISANIGDWSEPYTDNPVLTGVTVTSGRTADGNDAKGAVRMPVTRHVRFRVTETGGANPVSVTVFFQYQ